MEYNHKTYEKSMILRALSSNFSKLYTFYHSSQTFIPLLTFFQKTAIFTHQTVVLPTIYQSVSTIMRILLITALLLPLQILAQGFQVNLQGQTQQGMASAGTGLIQDASSLFFNPGGASFVDRNEISLGTTFTLAKGAFLEDHTFETASTTSPMSTPFTAYGLFQLKDSSKLKLGVAVYTPFGSTVEWEDGWSGRFALTRLQLLSIFFQPTVSYRITDKIGLGAGFIYSYGKVNLQKDIPVIDANGDYGHVELNGTGQGFGYNVGIYFEPIEQLSIGLTYRSQVNMKMSSGTATFTVPQSLEEKFPSGDFTGSLPLPQVFTLGLGIHPTKKWDIALDVNYVGWKAYDTLAFDYATNTESLEDTKSARNYENIFAFRLGGQYAATENLFIRAGIGYGISPVQDGYVTPETPDANRLNYTVGLGYNLGDHFTVDASFLYTKAERNDRNLETNLSGTFKVHVFAPGVALTYKF